VILVDWHPRQQELRQAVEKRLREELAQLPGEGTEEKPPGELQPGEGCGFLGLEFRRIQSRRGRGMPRLWPKGKQRTAWLGQLQEIFRASGSQPVGEGIQKIHPILRGGVQYLARGHSSRCFSSLRYGVEKKMRRHLARGCQRPGFGWKR
jgi:hypothetical protein